MLSADIVFSLEQKMIVTCILTIWTQYGPRSDCSIGSSLIWVQTVCYRAPRRYSSRPQKLEMPVNVLSNTGNAEAVLGMILNCFNETFQIFLIGSQIGKAYFFFFSRTETYCGYS